MTKQRKLILEIIQSSHRHLTAEEIFIKAKEKMQHIAMGTVYRNINLMVEDGIIERISIPNSADRFDKNPDDHDHAVCVNCGNVIDVKINGLKDFIENSLGKPIISYELNLKLNCDDCEGKIKEEIYG